MAQQEDDNLQNLHPETVLLTAELLGNLSALQMPFNVQNLIGNWLVLIGQIFLVFNAQLLKGPSCIFLQLGQVSWHYMSWNLLSTDF